MDALFVPLAGAVGASVDQVKLISCLLIAYPLGSIFVRIPASSPNLRHLFNICVSLFYLLPMLGLYTGFLQLLADILVTYFLAKFWKESGESKKMPWFIFAFILGHLMYNHIIRAIYQLSYETMEVTGPQMVLTMKLTTFAWNVWDGRRDKKDLDKWQLENSVKEFPSLLEFLGYTLYFPGVLVGPSLVFADYRNLVNDRGFTAPASTTTSNGKDKPRGRLLPPGRKRVGYRKMLTGLAFLGIFVVFGGSNNFSVMVTPWFKEQSWGKRILLAQVYGTFERTKYYAIWTLTEGAAILTGYGFTGYHPTTGKSTWNGAANVIPLNIEYPSNFKVLLDSWNMKANVWLKECVYKRLAAKGAKPGFWSSMGTFGTSAFWHGTQIGYYMTFLMGGFITSAARLARQSFRPLALPADGQQTPTTTKKHIYDFFASLTSLLILNYVASPFMLLTWSDSITAWSRLGWYGHMVIGGALVFFYSGGARWCRGIQKKRVARVNGKATGLKSKIETPVEEKTFQLPPGIDKVIPPPK